MLTADFFFFPLPPYVLLKVQWSVSPLPSVHCSLVNVYRFDVPGTKEVSAHPTPPIFFSFGSPLPPRLHFLSPSLTTVLQTDFQGIQKSKRKQIRKTSPPPPPPPSLCLGGEKGKKIR
eukprot:TRINITY_DN367_c0_g2_i2.p1 TRINITY_DN367_c0_g2~~TRINITY_DN367_c0_g2_i2.p1  ORF type:complete len:118 (+),score=3.75 TRINITY_DN367_c0_g2_i2:372-725(+)